MATSHLQQALLSVLIVPLRALAFSPNIAIKTLIKKATGPLFCYMYVSYFLLDPIDKRSTPDHLSMASPISPVNPFPFVKKRLGGEEYVIEAELAKGAVWRVLKSKRLTDNKYFAIKEALTVNIRQEVEILSRCVGHNNIVQLIKACRDDDEKQKSPLYTYLITELCSIDLSIFLRDLGGRLPPSQLRVAAKQLADGYLVLYNSGILHKNISSKNVLVHFLGTVSFDGPRVYPECVRNRFLAGNHAILKMSGFNCAVIVPEKPSFMKRSYSITGRAQYMAPEIGRGFVKSKRTSTEYTPKSDMWSLGILFYEMAFGKFPITSSALLDLFKAPRQEKASIDFESLSVPEFAWFCSLIRRLLRVNVDERPDPSSLCKDECFAELEPNAPIFIGNDQINDAIRLYDLYWTLPAPVPSAPIAIVRVRDYEYNEMTELGSYAAFFSLTAVIKTIIFHFRQRQLRQGMESQENHRWHQSGAEASSQRRRGSRRNRNHADSGPSESIKADRPFRAVPLHVHHH